MWATRFLKIDIFLPVDISESQRYSLHPAYLLQIHESGRAAWSRGQARWGVSNVQFPMQHLVPQKLGVSCHITWNLRVVANTVLCPHRDGIRSRTRLPTSGKGRLGNWATSTPRANHSTLGHQLNSGYWKRRFLFSVKLGSSCRTFRGCQAILARPAPAQEVVLTWIPVRKCSWSFKENCSA